MHSCRSQDTKNSYCCSALGLDTFTAGDFTFGLECLASTILGTERRKGKRLRSRNWMGRKDHTSESVVQNLF